MLGELSSLATSYDAPTALRDASAVALAALESILTPSSRHAVRGGGAGECSGDAAGPQQPGVGRSKRFVRRRSRLATTGSLSLWGEL